MRALYQCSAAVLTLIALPAGAQDATGTWSAAVNTGNGSTPLNFEFKVDGDKLTGAFFNTFIPAVPIEEGVVSGNELSFKLRMQTVVLGYKGTLAGDKLTLSSFVVEGRPPGGPEEQTFTATRVK